MILPEKTNDEIVVDMCKLSTSIATLEYLLDAYKVLHNNLRAKLTGEGQEVKVSLGNLFSYDAKRDIATIAETIQPLALLPGWVRACSKVEAEEAQKKYDLNEDITFAFTQYIAITLYREAFKYPYYMENIYPTLKEAVGSYADEERIKKDVDFVCYQYGLR